MKTRLLLFTLALAACPDDDVTPNPSGSGELGVGTFTYLCRSEGDFTCSIGQTSADFPPGFALGGRFGISYAWKSETDHINDPLPALQTADADRLQQSDQSFVALQAGYAAILAATGNSQIVDLIHANIRPIDDLRLVDAFLLPAVAPLIELALPPDASATVQLVPLDIDDTPLSGALDLTWTVDDESVVGIAVGQGTGRVRVDTLAAGTATLTAALGDKTASVTITVDPDLQPTTTESTLTEATTTLTTGTGETGTGTTGPDTDATGGDTDDASTSADTTAGTTGTTADTTGGAL
jgi:hypothetical protein